MEARIYIDDAEFERLSRLFAGSPEIFRKAVRASLRRVGGNMRKNIVKGIRGASYLKGRDITDAIGRLQVTDTEASVRVAGRMLPADRFKLVPRITARKGARSVNWPSPGVTVGPGEPVRHLEKAGFSKPFITKFKNGHKGMYWREKSSGKLKTPYLASPQYFAAFDKVKEPVLTEAQRKFLERLEHEIDYRIGLNR